MAELTNSQLRQLAVMFADELRKVLPPADSGRGESARPRAEVKPRKEKAYRPDIDMSLANKALDSLTDNLKRVQKALKSTEAGQDHLNISSGQLIDAQSKLVRSIMEHRDLTNRAQDKLRDKIIKVVEADSKLAQQMLTGVKSMRDLVANLDESSDALKRYNDVLDDVKASEASKISDNTKLRKLYKMLAGTTLAMNKSFEELEALQGTAKTDMLKHIDEQAKAHKKLNMSISETVRDHARSSKMLVMFGDTVKGMDGIVGGSVGRLAAGMATIGGSISLIGSGISEMLTELRSSVSQGISGDFMKLSGISLKMGMTINDTLALFKENIAQLNVLGGMENFRKHLADVNKDFAEFKQFSGNPAQQAKDIAAFSEAVRKSGTDIRDRSAFNAEMQKQLDTYKNVRVATGQTAEEFAKSNQAILESAAVQNSAMSLDKRWRRAQMDNILSMKAEMSARGMSAKAQEDIINTMNDLLGGSVQKRMDARGDLAKLASSFGIDQNLFIKAQSALMKGRDNSTPEERAALDDFMKIANAGQADRLRSAGDNEGAVLAAQNQWEQMTKNITPQLDAFRKGEVSAQNGPSSADIAARYLEGAMDANTAEVVTMLSQIQNALENPLIKIAAGIAGVAAGVMLLNARKDGGVLDSLFGVLKRRTAADRADGIDAPAPSTRPAAPAGGAAPAASPSWRPAGSSSTMTYTGPGGVKMVSTDGGASWKATGAPASSGPAGTTSTTIGGASRTATGAGDVANRRPSFVRDVAESRPGQWVGGKYQAAKTAVVNTAVAAKNYAADKATRAVGVARRAVAGPVVGIEMHRQLAVDALRNTPVGRAGAAVGRGIRATGAVIGRVGAGVAGDAVTAGSKIASMASGAASAGVKAIGGLATKIAAVGIKAVPILGQLYMAGDAIYEGMKNANRASEIFGTKALTTGQKIAAGIGGALSTLTFGLVSPQTFDGFVRGMYNTITNFVPWMKEKIDQIGVFIGEGLEGLVNNVIPVLWDFVKAVPGFLWDSAISIGGWIGEAVISAFSPSNWIAAITGEGGDGGLFATITRGFGKTVQFLGTAISKGIIKMVFDMVDVIVDKLPDWTGAKERWEAFKQTSLVDDFASSDTKFADFDSPEEARARERREAERRARSVSRQTPQGTPTSPYASATGAQNGQGGNVRTYQNEDGTQTQKVGGSRAWRNNNAGNMRYSEYSRAQGAIGQDADGFAIFASEADGMRAQENLLRGSTYRDLNIAQAIARYAPSSENNTAEYIRQVGRNTGMDVNGKTIAQMSPTEFNSFVEAIRKHEGYRVGTVNGNPVAQPQQAVAAHRPTVQASPVTPSGQALPSVALSARAQSDRDEALAVMARANEAAARQAGVRTSGATAMPTASAQQRTAVTPPAPAGSAAAEAQATVSRAQAAQAAQQAPATTNTTTPAPRPVEPPKDAAVALLEKIAGILERQLTAQESANLQAMLSGQFSDRNFAGYRGAGLGVMRDPKTA